MLAKLPNISPMETPQKWNQSLIQIADKQAIIEEMVGQIKKDFGMFSENITFDETAIESYNNLFQQLENYLNQHFSPNTERLYPILYRIDILEKDIQFAISQQGNFNFISLITEQIILKELQKVMIRRHYREKKV
jgi:hypothetical protein